MSSAPYPYCYRPLPPGPDKIRLLHLLPSEDENAPIQCKLIDYSLQNSGKRKHLYEALSYVWGSEQKPNSLLIGDYFLPITLSLHEALLRLRDHALGRYMWIDAVCINQNDDREKEHQIGLMAHIYSHASRTIVWLGEAADDSDRAIENIRLAANGRSDFGVSEKGRSRPHVSADDLSGNDFSEFGLSKNYRRRPNLIPEEQGIVALLERSWFCRIWVSSRNMCGV
jgi:Heterokaryon incompatibility protein (HET)